MGTCISSAQSEQINIDEIDIDREPNGTPSNWNQHQVINWLKTTDLTAEDQHILSKKFKKYKINGPKLSQLTTDQKLKETLKIRELRLRLELMKCIDKKLRKPVENYQLPPYYPFDYKYRCFISNEFELEQVAINTTIARPVYDRLSWTQGTVVLIYDRNYDTWCPSQIVQVMNMNYITVVYEQPNGFFASMKLNRFNTNLIKSDLRFMKNRVKLQKNCMLEVFDDLSGNWTHSYIKSSKNNDSFVISHNNQHLCYNRWSPKIRCSEALLNLTINSELHVWNCELKSYCFAKIIEIDDLVDGNKLDIFKIIYKTENNDYFFKYIHQFSANILLLNNDEQRCSHYTDLEVAMYSKYSNIVIKHDVTDEMHYDLLLKGWLRSIYKSTNSKSDNDGVDFDFVNLLCMLMNNGNYIGANYGLIMYLESKYWSGLSFNKNF